VTKLKDKQTEHHRISNHSPSDLFIQMLTALANDKEKQYQSFSLLNRLRQTFKVNYGCCGQKARKNEVGSWTLQQLNSVTLDDVLMKNNIVTHDMFVYR